MLLPLPPHPYDIGTLCCSSALLLRFRLKVDTNTYSVPTAMPAPKFSLKTLPRSASASIHDHNLTHAIARRYDRHKDYEDPDHAKG